MNRRKPLNLCASKVTFPRSSIASMTAGSESLSVSYTHLDVYKRQAFIEGRIVVEFHELRDLNGLKASQQVFSGAVHFFDAYVMHDADVHGFRKDVLQICLLYTSAMRCVCPDIPAPIFQVILSDARLSAISRGRAELCHSYLKNRFSDSWIFCVSRKWYPNAERSWKKAHPRLCREHIV